MSMKELVVCKFAGCDQVYKDPRILPCGHRTCASHIQAMIVKTDDINPDNRQMLKCHFCEEIHSYPEQGREFPVDRSIHLLLNMTHCSEHDAAKQSFNEVTQLLDKLIKLDSEDYVIDYFERVEADILLEKEVNMKKLVDYYQKLVDYNHKRKIKCLHNVKTSNTLIHDLDALKQKLIGHESKLKKDNLDFVLKTLDGNETKWKAIQAECNNMLEATKLLGQELKERIVGNQMIKFESNTSNNRLEDMFGRLYEATIDSTIIINSNMCGILVELCKLEGKEFKLLYRASRDGFQASDFHAKCDNRPKTLTIVRTTKGFIFGAYTAVTWASDLKPLGILTSSSIHTNYYKVDPNAFIFSLLNAIRKPQIIPIKGASSGMLRHKDKSVPASHRRSGTSYATEDFSAICCHSAYGPTFGGGHDIHISNNSNAATSESYSNLGHSFDFKLSAYNTEEAESFLAGSYNFQTAEIEVFQLN